MLESQHTEIFVGSSGIHAQNNRVRPDDGTFPPLLQAVIPDAGSLLQPTALS